MYKLGLRSMKNLANVHNELRIILETAIMLTQVDFTVTEGHRSIERQLELYAAGKTTVKKGKHNSLPSMAIDFIACVKGKPELAYDKSHLMYLVGVFTATAELLYKQGIIKHRLRSGSNWDMDGELVFDQTFQDMPHIELI